MIDSMERTIVALERQRQLTIDAAWRDGLIEGKNESARRRAEREFTANNPTILDIDAQLFEKRRWLDNLTRESEYLRNCLRAATAAARIWEGVAPKEAS